MRQPRKIFQINSSMIIPIDLSILIIITMFGDIVHFREVLKNCRICRKYENVFFFGELNMGNNFFLTKTYFLHCNAPSDHYLKSYLNPTGCPKIRFALFMEQFCQNPTPTPTQFNFSTDECLIN